MAHEPFTAGTSLDVSHQAGWECMLAGCPVDGKVLDPFAGAGTTGLVADRLGRDAILIELNPVYCEMAAQRIRADAPLLPIVITGVEGRFAPEASSSHRAASQRLSSS